MKSVTQYTRISAAVIAAAMLAACSGGTNGGFGAPGGVTPNLRTLTPVTPVAPEAHKGKRGKAKISIRIPLKKKRGHQMHPEYISPSTQSMTVATTGSVPLQTFNLTPTSAGCTTSAGVLSCSETAYFPAGQQTLTLTLFDQQNGAGNQLSTASQQVTITAGTATNITVTLNGVPSSATVLLNGSAAASIPQGVATSVPATVTAKDADGNIIMSPGNYSSAITLSDSDTSGATTLSTTSVTAPGASITVSYNGSAISSATITPSINGTAQSAGAATLTLTSAAPQPTFGPTTAVSGDPGTIKVGPDGNLWFNEFVNGGNTDIGTMTTSGTVLNTYPANTGGPGTFTVGPDNNLWFTLPSPGSTNQESMIGQMTTAGVVTFFPLPGQYKGTNSAGYGLTKGITTGPDGNLWFTGSCDNGNFPDTVIGVVGSMTTTGTVTEYSLPTSINNPSSPNGITKGPDGALWFTDNNRNLIGRITTTGTLTEYSTPTSSSEPASITVGPDGALWFTEAVGNNIGRITTAGTITEYSIPTSGADPHGITVGADGALWFTETGYTAPSLTGQKIGRITTSGTITEYSVPITNTHQGPQPDGIVAGPGGAQTLYFTEYGQQEISVLTLPTGSSARHRGTQPIRTKVTQH